MRTTTNKRAAQRRAIRTTERRETAGLAKAASREGPGIEH